MGIGRRVVALGAAVTLTLAGTTVSAHGASASRELDLRAVLHHSASHPLAHGVSEYERGGGHRKVEVTVSVPGLAGHLVTVRVNGKRVGTMRLSARGFGDREWKTERGQVVPFASAGSPVRIWKTGTRDLVLSGIYRLDR